MCEGTCNKPSGDEIKVFPSTKGGTGRVSEINTPPYYDNSNGSLYKIASHRGWSPYTFDVVKRLDRGGKKDSLKQEIEKSIAVLQLWLKEMAE